MTKTNKLEERKTIRQEFNVKYYFTDEDINKMGKQLAESQMQKRSLEDDFKAVRDEWKSRLASIESLITQLSTRVNSGYEYRVEKCTVYLDTPSKGQKSVINPYTNEIDRVIPMTSEDMQAELFEDKEEEEA